MPKENFTRKECRLIESLLEEFDRNYRELSTFQRQVLTALEEDDLLAKHVHSIKSRIKNRDHLRDKLERKLRNSKEEGCSLEISDENLLTKINDLVGIRILHLYTAQLAELNPAILRIFDEQQYRLIEGPFARTWDDESREFFRDHNIEAQQSDTLYTSVHYVIESASRKKMTCEIQVRTLSEEVWGEVDHQLNYPHQTDSLACSEQLKVLARLTSSVSRLVDSIFRTENDHRLKMTYSQKDRITKAKSGVSKKKRTRKKAVTKKI
ncbi:uncharacterized protein FOKN1_0628 [Thiohalobacter thiocyanaticus]|uniref:RelA/SpoT domain-containing protein n=1 Tax=Thiohalobacter thiocyanaticus TaxID=585455 RepID=A0A1Z4VN24_9GAMM|nr:RelA/SpoT domain-containing protein [Thiohalobacter thiocyanaticus]BAZ93030.1 uncharacterized protein FOKN1_0628 [Thiohalobacter thiocyanaticus]